MVLTHILNPSSTSGTSSSSSHSAVTHVPSPVLHSPVTVLPPHHPRNQTTVDRHNSLLRPPSVVLLSPNLLHPSLSFSSEMTFPSLSSKESLVDVKIIPFFPFSFSVFFSNSYTSDPPILLSQTLSSLGRSVTHCLLGPPRPPQPL